MKDINETLLAKMEKMVKTRSLMLPTVRAWGWLVKLLGGLAGQHRILVNQLLKILEITFVSSDDLVRLASLVSNLLSYNIRHVHCYSLNYRGKILRSPNLLGIYQNTSL